MEGRDALFGDMLESISQKVESEDKNEATKNTQDPLKTKSPKELKGDGKKDMKIQKMGEDKEEEASEAKDGKANDPLKTSSPKELKGDGKKDMKLQKMGKEPLAHVEQIVPALPEELVLDLLKLAIHLF